MNISIISAGAGSGKTYHLMQTLAAKIKSGIPVSSIIATTFTEKAAQELRERVAAKLLEEGLIEAASQLPNAYIGTVHSIGQRLLKRFAFEAGMSPSLDLIPQEDERAFFEAALSTILDTTLLPKIEFLASKFGQASDEGSFVGGDWRKLLRDLSSLIRSNDMSDEQIQAGLDESLHELRSICHPIKPQDGDIILKLEQEIAAVLAQIDTEVDGAKVTFEYCDMLKGFQKKLAFVPELSWAEWNRIATNSPAKKSSAFVADLQLLAANHIHFPEFYDEISRFITLIYQAAASVKQEYQEYKNKRGRIDFNDMETGVSRLLRKESVRAILQEELQLLIVDEFQDTNPIQLDIFLQLCDLAGDAIWVGDSKQCLYGFRGSDPKLMQEVVEQLGGIKPENVLKNSWRSRRDLVECSNAIFGTALIEQMGDRAFIDLEPIRVPQGSKTNELQIEQPDDLQAAIHHWVFHVQGKGRDQGWKIENLAARIRQLIKDKELRVVDKETNQSRPLRASDIAILTRTNKGSNSIAEALSQQGIRVAIKRGSLLATKEARLLTAALRIINSDQDSLAVAEMIAMSTQETLQEILDERHHYLQSEQPQNEWGRDRAIIEELHSLRERRLLLSPSELLTLVIERTQVREIIASWSDYHQRQANIDILCAYVSKYESACKAMLRAATLGGFLLFLQELEANNLDQQAIPSQADAVQITTYHRSKGLEYKIVICHELDSYKDAKYQGIRVVSQHENFNLQDPLSGRVPVMRISPYGSNSKKGPFFEKIAELGLLEEMAKTTLDEAARVLYVGLTRARDYLIIPTFASLTAKKLNVKWLDLVCNMNQNQTAPVLNLHAPPEYAADRSLSESPWVDRIGEPIPMQYEYIHAYRDLVHHQTEYQAVELFVSKQKNNDDLAALVELSKVHEIDRGELLQYAENEYSSERYLQLKQVSFLALSIAFSQSFYVDQCEQLDHRFQYEHPTIEVLPFNVAEAFRSQIIKQAQGKGYSMRNTNIRIPKDKQYAQAELELQYIGTDTIAILTTDWDGKPESRSQCLVDLHDQITSAQALLEANLIEGYLFHHCCISTIELIESK